MVTDITELELIRQQLVLDHELKSYDTLDDLDRNHYAKSEVPPIIHQIYWDFATGSTSIPDKWRSSKEAWINHHPNAIYIQWTDVMLRDLISTHYPFFLTRYDSYYHDNERVDTGRTFILHRYGGIYSDMNLVPNKNVWHLFNGQEDLYIVNDSGRYINSLLASPPLSPFWSFLWRYLLLDYNSIDLVVKQYTRTIGLLPGQYVQPCTESESRPCTKPGAYFTILDKGSQNQWKSIIVRLFTCYWYYLIVIILILIILIILWLCHRPNNS